MCGIFVSIRFASSETPDLEEPKFATLSLALQRANAARGPDAQSTYALSLIAAPHPTVLPVDSDVTASTPNIDNPRLLDVAFYGSELRLRGDRPIVQPHVRDGNVLCWNGEIFEGMDMSPEENDGVKLFDTLCSATTSEQIRDIFSSVEGPYAFAFYHAKTQHLYFARDPLGRRSLLIHKPTKENTYLLLTSVSAGANSAYEFTEISTEHIYSLDLRHLKDSRDITAGFPQLLTGISRAPDTPNASHSFAKPSKVNTTAPIDNIHSVGLLDDIPEHLRQPVDDLILHLDQSVRLQVLNIPWASVQKGKARLAVLFSGGIDCTIITYLAHRYIPPDEPIDLLNVAFENPRKIRNQQGHVDGAPQRAKKAQAHRNGIKPESIVASYLVPDRVTGLSELEELRRVCPGRIWNFVEVNVPYLECQTMRPVVESLMSPGRTVMDLSLALALYFASRGQGQIRETPGSPPEPYTSEARVLLNGLGSDELLGGYGRHRTVYNDGGWAALIEELQQEIDRIPTRNLGRDDRIVSSHGKEARHAFLSLTLVSFVASLPVHFKVDPRLENGIGDKILLRLAARKLGLIEASSRKKRAMQFGSHSARMEGERRGDVDISIL